MEARSGRDTQEMDFIMLRFMQGVAATPVRYTLRERTRWVHYTPYEGLNLANQISKNLIGSWREATIHFVVI